MKQSFVALLMALFAGAASAARLHGAEPPPDFTREVRPILAKHCLKCHGPDDGARKAGLRLDTRAGALQPAKSGAAAVVPRQPARSELVRRIRTGDADDVMPPPGAKLPLSEADKATLERWIATGAEYKAHWAFVPPVRSPLPRVSKPAWTRNGIDAWILARLDREGLSPAPPASRYALVRRVYLDLVGLPPTPEEADAFVRSQAPDAYETLVDRLLASPRYGERWGRRWLDLARYADTNGYEKDRPRSIWPWRDWVVRALNADMPFDQFTIEQLAGDLLPGATLDQRIATGFHRNTMLNEEGGIDPLEFRYHAMTDRVNTTGTTWLGLTVGCAQCHTHKYDPITQREYYELMAFLDNADEPDLDLPAPGAAARRRANLDKAARLLAELPDRFPVDEVLWDTPPLLHAEAESGEKPRLLDDHSALFAGAAPDHDTYTLTFDSDLEGADGLRLEALTDEALPKKGPGRVAHGNFVLSEITVTAAPKAAPGSAAPVVLAGGSADVEQSGFAVTNALDGKLETGWAVHADDKTLNQNHSATFRFEKPAGFPGGTRYVVQLIQKGAPQHLVGRPRVSLRAPVRDARPMAVRRKEVLDKRFAEWLRQGREQAVDWTPLRPVKATSNLPLLTPQPDESVLASGDITKSDVYELTFRPGLKGITALRLEALPDDRLPGHGPGLAFYEGPKGDFFLTEFQVSADGEPLKFAGATASYARNNFGERASAELAVDGDPQTGWSAAGRPGERHEAVFPLAAPLDSAGELRIKMLFGRHYACSLGKFRISATTRAGGARAQNLPPEAARLLLLPDAALTSEQRRTLLEQFLLSAPELAKEQGEIESLRRPPAQPVTLVLRERPPENPRPTHIHRRGEYLQAGDRVEPGVIAAVGPFPREFPGNRFGFARWLVSTNNPLTARVTVNRQWQAFFARGLVRTLEDFGVQGEAPSHPELLDWLAVEFMDSGWSLKKLHRLIVTSAAYRQSSAGSPEEIAADPENRLLARGPQGRLDAEIIRDAALRASGLLSAKMGGPGVYPPQPAGVTEVAYGSPSWDASQGEDRYRRSLYTFAKRAAPFAMFNTFDAPNGEFCTARRDVSDTPLQALTLLNDTLLIEASQALGRDLAAGRGPAEDRIRLAFRRCVTRPPEPGETALLTQFYQAQERRFTGRELDPVPVAGDGPGDAAQRAAWTTVARALFNLDEMITKY